MAQKKTWREKLADSKELPKVVTLNEAGRRHWKGASMAVPSPMEVNAIMAAVPKGKLITVKQIREKVARKHRADIGCPLTCGMFSQIAAHAAAEEAANGAREVTPFWRTLKAEGELNPKYPGGIEAQKRLLESEGHHVVQRGKRFVVEEYEQRLVQP
jgi:alkylated DNA nucleotide flippase Atl1